MIPVCDISRLFRARDERFLMLTAFLDESYDQKIFTIGGFLSWEDEWRKVEKKWKAVIRGNGIERFHATDCNNGFDEFKDWPAERRTGLTKRLIRILTEHELYGLFSGAVQPDLRDVLQAKRDDDAYPLCLQHCLEVIGEKTARLPLTEQVDVILDSSRFSARGAELFHWMKFERSWQHGSRFRNITYSRWQDFIPLQCADLMVYEAFKMLRRTEFDKERPERKSFTVLSGRPIFGGHFDREAMEGLRDFVAAEDRKKCEKLV